MVYLVYVIQTVLFRLCEVPGSGTKLRARRRAYIGVLRLHFVPCGIFAKHPFITKEECFLVLVHALPTDANPCRGVRHRFFFSSRTNRRWTWNVKGRLLDRHHLKVSVPWVQSPTCRGATPGHTGRPYRAPLHVLGDVTLVEEAVTEKTCIR